MTLTLPIVAGKKYVRRDGVVIEARMVTYDGGRPFSHLVVGDPTAEPSANNTVQKAHGRVWEGKELPFDFVADYIEPAKGHPHAALILQFAQDAQESQTPWDRWECAGSNGPWHPVERCAPTWESWLQYRRKVVINPDPHAQSAAEYAKDMAETDKAWERWEGKFSKSTEWHACTNHPAWNPSYSYRRKEAL